MSGSKSSFKLYISTLAAALSCVVLFACDESLPPRDDPQRYLQASLSVVQGVVTIDLDGTITNAGVLTLTTRNTYNEVLQGETFLQGEVEVWMRDDPNQRAVVRLDKGDLISTWIVGGGLTTLRPDSPAVFVKQWSHMTTGGAPLWGFVRLTPRMTAHGAPFCESDPVHLVAEGSVQLFKNVAPVKTTKIEFTLVYQVFGISCD